MVPQTHYTVLTMDPERSMRLARQLRSRMFVGHNPYMKALHYLPEYADAFYLEGWILTDAGLAIPYYWLETDSVILDPLLAQSGRFPLAYFAANRFTFEEAMREQIGAGMVYANHGYSPHMQLAQEAASMAAMPYERGELIASKCVVKSYLRLSGFPPEAVARMLGEIGYGTSSYPPVRTPDSPQVDDPATSA